MYGQYRNEIRKFVMEGKTPAEISVEIEEIPYQTIYKWCQVARLEVERFTLGENPDEEEMANDNVMLSKSRQKMMDKNRIREKTLREGYRKVNAVEEYACEMIGLLEKNQFHKIVRRHDDSGCKAVAVIHLSDLHFNELINIGSNKFDFKIASARMKLFAKRIKQYLSPYEIKNIVVAMTGDMLNSDRRLDEMLSQATNRTRATFLAVDILQQFLMDLNQNFNMTVTYVTGNESRAKDEVGWTESTMSDNYDTMIFGMLRRMFVKCDGITFHEGDISEQTFKVGPLNFLMIHGNGAVSKEVEKSVEQIKGRYAGRGEVIDYVIFGHLHSARIGDTYARSASLAGSNSFNEGSLNLYGRASQNIYIVHKGGLRDGVKVDLQTTDDTERYDIDHSLEAYNTKSADKNRKKTVVFEVTI